MAVEANVFPLIGSAPCIPVPPKTLKLPLQLSSMAGKTYRDSHGYLRFRDSGRLVHRWAAEKKLGRKLSSGEVVHHSNRIKTDNRRRNLIVFSSQKEHRAQHIKQSWERPRYGRSRR
ncbi:MAG: hypothetical protein EAX95_10595 [Candidatus Thorarchaeota archaeon]|nr:hypothetical protein [Candidatus Thorarchaeota archaeon]